jgi:hypothetical protein
MQQGEANGSPVGWPSSSGSAWQAAALCAAHLGPAALCLAAASGRAGTSPAQTIAGTTAPGHAMADPAAHLLPVGLVHAEFDGSNGPSLCLDELTLLGFALQQPSTCTQALRSPACTSSRQLPTHVQSAGQSSCTDTNCQCAATTCVPAHLPLATGTHPHHRSSPWSPRCARTQLPARRCRVQSKTAPSQTAWSAGAGRPRRCPGV